MLKAVCTCGEEITEEDLAPFCDRCGKQVEEEMLGDAVQFLVSPGDDDPEGEGPQYLAVMSSDINGEPDGGHYCKTCTAFLLDQSFIRDMQQDNQASDNGEPENAEPENAEPEDEEPENAEPEVDGVEEGSEPTE